MSKKCYVWILKQRNVNKSYDNHNYINCKGNRNNNTNRKQARLSVVMTLRFIHDYAQQGESMFWKWLGMRSCRPSTCLRPLRGPLVRVRGSWQAQNHHEKVTSNGMARVLSWKSERILSQACAGWCGKQLHLVEGVSVSLSCLHLQKSQHRRMVGQLHPPLSRETHILGQVVHGGCRERHTDTLAWAGSST